MHTEIQHNPSVSHTTIAVLIGCLLTVLVAAGPASAGVATIKQCRGAGNELIDGGASGGFISFAPCAGGGGASLLSSGTAGAQAPVAFRNLTFTAPGSTTFVGGTLYRQIHNYYWSTDTGGESWDYGYVLTDGKGSTLESCGFSGVALSNCYTNTSYFTVFPAAQIELPTYDSGKFTLTVGCAKVGKCHHYYSYPGVDGVAADLLVRDDAAAVPTGVSGPLATAGVITAGENRVTLGATDTGGLGVYDARLLVDDVVTATEAFGDNGGRCVDGDPGAGVSWNSGQPCPTAAPAREFTFPGLPEGAHNIKVQVRDAALNETIAVNRDVTIDMVPSPTMLTAPAITGTPRAGRSLAVSPGTWDGHGNAVGFSYRWLLCDAAGEGCADTGQTTALYDIPAADAYHRLVAEVTASSAEGTTTTRSQPTTVVHDANDLAAPPSSTDTRTNPPGGDANGAVRGAPNGVNATDDAILRAAFGNHKGSQRISFGARPVIRGTLTDARGRPIGNARIEMLSRLAMGGARSVDKGGARTRTDGSWTLILPRDLSSRTLTLRYRSHLQDTKPVAAVVLKLSVRAGLTLRITPRLSHNHGTIHFRGRVLGHSIPAKGKVVELQARGKGHTRWITFKTLRVRRGGALHSTYTFHASSAVSYQFRARARAESGYPFLSGVSSVVGVRVR